MGLSDGIAKQLIRSICVNSVNVANLYVRAGPNLSRQACLAKSISVAAEKPIQLFPQVSGFNFSDLDCLEEKVMIRNWPSDCLAAHVMTDCGRVCHPDISHTWFMLSRLVFEKNSKQIEFGRPVSV
jgi:hypothetical protein